MKNYILVFILFVMSGLTAQAAKPDSGFVGNGGEGIDLNGHIVLRDLYQFQISDPYFGPATQEDLDSVVLYKNKLPFSVDTQLFASKISDLNRIRPGLGNIALLILDKFYHIKFTASELPLTKEEVGDVPESARVQLAIRRYNDITFSTSRLNQLDEKQKVALLIHELLFSLIKPVCTSGDICNQSSNDIRQIIGPIFRNDLGTNKELSNLINAKLSIPNEVEACSTKDLTSTLEFFTNQGTRPQPAYKLVTSNLTNNDINDPSILKQHEEFCSSSPINDYPLNLLVATFDEKILQIERTMIRSDFGVQNGLKVRVYSQIRKLSLINTTTESCKTDLQNEFALFKSKFFLSSLALYCK